MSHFTLTFAQLTIRQFMTFDFFLRFTLTSVNKVHADCSLNMFCYTRTNHLRRTRISSRCFLRIPESSNQQQRFNIEVRGSEVISPPRN